MDAESEGEKGDRIFPTSSHRFPDFPVLPAISRYFVSAPLQWDKIFQIRSHCVPFLLYLAFGQAMPPRLSADTSRGAVRPQQASIAIDRTHDHILSKSKGLGKRQMFSGFPNAIALVEVPEQSDGHLMVQHEGKAIAHQEAPPKAGALRAAQGALAPTPELAQVVRNLSQHGLTRLQLQRLPALEASVDQPMDDENVPTPYTPPTRQATPRKQALWKVVHHARLQGVSLKAIAKQLGISRNTVRK